MSELRIEKKKPKVTVSLRLRPEVLAEVSRLAQRAKASMAQTLEAIVTLYIEKQR